MVKMPVRFLRNSLMLCALVVLPSACASSQTEGMSHMYAMDGPPLALVGKLGDLAVEGSMDRTCMAGVGMVSLHSRFIEDALVCSAVLDVPPNEKARVKGVLRCENNPPIFFTMRNLGPDQGVAVGRSEGSEELLVFFYHPSREEAERRLPEVLGDIQKAQAQAKAD